MQTSEHWEKRGRRSRLEIVCDILLAVKDGAEKPTRIMQRANLTWRYLLMYLEVLIRNRLVVQVTEDDRAFYRLSEKGAVLLDQYIRLRDDMAQLDLDSMQDRTPSIFDSRLVCDEGDERILREKLVARGFEMVSEEPVARPGLKHGFTALAKGADGSVHGFIFLPQLKDADVVELYIVQLDAGVTVHAVVKGDVVPSARDLAHEYRLSVERLED